MFLIRRLECQTGESSAPMESETLHSAHLRAVSLSSLGLSKKAAAAAAEKLTTTTLEGGMRDYVEPPIDEWMLNDVQNIFSPYQPNWFLYLIVCD